MEELYPDERGSRASCGILCVLLLVGSLGSTGVARAEEITFDEALALGQRSPAVKQPQERLESRESGDEKVGTAAGQTNLLFLPGQLIWPREDKGFEMQATITQGWNLSRLGDARNEAAGSERGELTASIRAKALRARLSAARRWIDVATLEQLSGRIERRIRGMEELVAVRERALATGVGTAQQVAAAQVALAQLKAQRLRLEGDAFAAAIELSLAIGRPVGSDPVETVGDLPHPPLPDDAEIELLIEDVDAAPDVVVARLGETAARARAAEISAAYAPVFTLGAQVERTTFGTWVVFGLTGVTFQSPGQTRRWASAAEAEAAGAGVDVSSARLEARAELEDALHELVHTAAVVELLEHDTLPALNQLVEQRTRAAALGEASRFAIFTTEDQQLAASEALDRARGAHAWARVRIWLLLAELSQMELAP